MEGIAVEVGQKLKSAIKAKLKELGAYVDDELSNYVMVMVTNRRSKAEMDRELQLFLGTNTSTFTSWLQSVWLKLEQVTVTNPGIESKRKTLEKKKKSKKSVKSSSESDDEKKHKKKRKTSLSDTVSKDQKKRKIAKINSGDLNKIEIFSEEQENDKHNSESSNVIEKQDNFMGNKKSNKDAIDSVEEEDFLNIKEDFESEFLSDNDYGDGNAKNKLSSSDEYSKKTSLKLDLKDKSVTTNVISEKKYRTKQMKDSTSKFSNKTKNILDHRPSVDTQNIDNGVMNKENSKNLTGSQLNIEKSNEITRTSKINSVRRPLIRDRKIKSRSRSRSPKSKSPLKTRTKNLVISSRSRSRSFSKSHSRSHSPVSQQQSKGISTIILKSKSRSPTSIASSKLIKIRETSPSVVDARELINRKRAMVLASEQLLNSKEQKLLTKRSRRIAEIEKEDDNESVENVKTTIMNTNISGGSKIIHIKGRDRSKENVNMVNSIDDDDYYNIDVEENYNSFENNDKLKNKYERKNTVENKYGRFIVSKRDGKRSVTVHSNLEKSYENSLSSTTNRNDTVDLREIRRTVYMEDKKSENITNLDLDDGDVDRNVKEKEEKGKLSKMIVNQIVKYIKEEPIVPNSVGKVTKITRPKTQTQLASSTLIRKAVADARKSLKSSKEEFLKKKEILESKTEISSKNKISEDKSAAPDQINSAKVDENSTHLEEPIDIDEIDKFSLKSKNENIDYNDEEKFYLKDDSPANNEDQIDQMQEEYDPSQNMPQFVVTLTGLDPKLFPQEDMEIEQLDSNSDDNKLKPKLQERCKYYPNCLAGDQCLFFHPVVPCKMFPNCKYGNNCLYIHPKCKFDNLCTRYDCTFLHSSPRVIPQASTRHSSAPPVINSQPCKFNYSCVNPLCSFAHPKICRFDRFCTNKNCTFSHTSLSHVFAVPKDKLKWSRPKDGEIKPDTAESKLEYDINNKN